MSTNTISKNYKHSLHFTSYIFCNPFINRLRVMCTQLHFQLTLQDFTNCFFIN